MTKKTSGKGTMLMSVLMSAPGPLVVGLGLLAGRSATQLADFIRRSAELLALIVAYLTFRRTASLEAQAPQKAELERRSNLFVGLAMCLSGGAMLLIALLGQESEQGNVIPGLCIAVLGVIANTIFWLRYRRLSRRRTTPFWRCRAACTVPSRWWICASRRRCAWCWCGPALPPLRILTASARWWCRAICCSAAHAP